ncbi:MAG: hypothetical protein IH621_18085 [Krumholzibacteria bacterium]|nr:hypothetical protein [Candidatus Krumholzibacteria bacterium]
MWHFSGYGTEAADCTRLNEMLLTTKAIAEAYAGMDPFFYNLHDLINAVAWNTACDPAWIAGGRELCERLSTQVMSAAWSALGLHQSALSALHPASPAAPGDVEHLIEELDRSQPFAQIEDLSLAIAQFAGALRSRILEMAQTIAADGRALCTANECQDGETLLAYVLSLGDRGCVDDEAFLANVRNWHEDCCGFWRLAMSGDRTEIPRAMITEGDEEMCVGTVTHRLTTGSGQPIAGVFLDCDLGYGHYLPGGESDANGEYRVSFSSRILGYGERFYCAETVTRTLNSRAYNPAAQEWTDADPIVVTFRNLVHSTTVNSSFNSTDNQDGEYFGDTQSTITGSGSNYAGTIYLCTDSCMGTVTRAYNSAGCMSGKCSETTIIEWAEVSGCCIIAGIDTYNRGTP